MTDDEILERLCNAPERVLADMIPPRPKLPHQQLFTAVQREPLSSLGTLGILPIEVLSECLMNLDIPSLQCVSCVCLSANHVIQSISRLISFTKLAEGTFALLAQRRILHLHPLNTLLAAFECEMCASCDGYGPLLVLMHAERCCLPCLAANQSLWPVDSETAEKCFGLTEEQAKMLPFMSREGKATPLTTVRAASQLAIKIHGSLEALQEKCPLERKDLERWQFSLWKWYREAPVKFDLDNYCRNVNVSDISSDVYARMGALYFPLFLNHRTEQPHWCRGCSAISSRLSHSSNPYASLSGIEARMIPPGYNPAIYMWLMSNKAWVKSELVQHVRTYHPDLVINPPPRFQF